MPTIKDILQEERNRENGWVVLFLEGKFWKAYERSAYALVRMYNFKPTKRYVKLVDEEVVSVGFPIEQLSKYSKQLSLKKYALLCEQMVSVEKNLNDWKQYYQNTITNSTNKNQTT